MVCCRRSIETVTLSRMVAEILRVETLDDHSPIENALGIVFLDLGATELLMS